MNNDLISRKALLEQVNEDKEIFESERVYLEGLILNAPAVEYPFYQEAYQTGYEEAKNERQIITIPHELINQMAMVIADSIDKIDWNAFLDKYIEMEKEWRNEEQNRQGN